MKSAIIGASAILLLCSSCLKDAVDERTIGYNTCNLIIPINQSEEPFATAASYTANVLVSDGKLGISSTVKLGTQELSLTTEKVNYESLTTDKGSLTTFKNATGKASGYPVTDFNGVISSIVFYPESATELPGINFTSASLYAPMTVFQYYLGNDYLVKTFSRDAVYYGLTETSVTGVEDPYSNKGILYRVVMSNDFKKADVVMYDAKLNDKMPSLTFVLKDLEVKFNRSGYTISGENLVPQVLEAGKYTPYEAFTFNSFSFTTTSFDLVNADIVFKVAGRFNGKFTGQYVVTELPFEE